MLSTISIPSLDSFKPLFLYIFPILVHIFLYLLYFHNFFLDSDISSMVLIDFTPFSLCWCMSVIIIWFDSFLLQSVTQLDLENRVDQVHLILNFIAERKFPLYSLENKASFIFPTFEYSYMMPHKK